MLWEVEVGHWLPPELVELEELLGVLLQVERISETANMLLN